MDLRQLRTEVRRVQLATDHVMEEMKVISSTKPTTAQIFSFFFERNGAHRLKILDTPITLTHMTLSSEEPLPVRMRAPSRRVDSKSKKEAARPSTSSAEGDTLDQVLEHHIVSALACHEGGGPIPYWSFVFHPVTADVDFETAFQWTLKCQVALSSLIQKKKVALFEDDSMLYISRVENDVVISNKSLKIGSVRSAIAQYNSRNIQSNVLASFHIPSPAIPIIRNRREYERFWELQHGEHASTFNDSD
ncbi:hypothetical protein RCL1_004457 [Eukaryota sp. TZLM3-RCL]